MKNVEFIPQSRVPDNHIRGKYIKIMQDVTQLRSGVAMRIPRQTSSHISYVRQLLTRKQKGKYGTTTVKNEDRTFDLYIFLK